MAQDYIAERRAPEGGTPGLGREEVYVEIFLEKEVIGGVDLNLDMSLPEVRQQLALHDVGVGHFDDHRGYLFLEKGGDPLSPAQEAESTVREVMVPDSIFPFIVLRLAPAEGTSEAELHFRQAMSFMAFKSRWNKAKSDTQLQHLEAEAKQIAESQRRDIEGIKEATRAEAEHLREAMATEQAAMEQEHAEELRRLTGRLAEEKHRIKEELLVQAREAESRVAESRLTALQKEQSQNQLMKGHVKELALRQWQSGALGNAVVQDLLAYIDSWRHNALHSLMANGLALALPELEYADPAIEARRKQAQALSRELQKELIFIKGMRDPVQLAAVKAVLREHVARSGVTVEARG